MDSLQVHQILTEHSIKREPMEIDEEQEVNDKAVVIDSTMEYCRNLG